MVVRLMKRWRSWPPWISKKYESNILVKRVDGLINNFDGKKRLVVEIIWKGQKSNIGLKRSVRKNFTEAGGFCGDGVVQWNQEFQSLCNFSSYKDGVFVPWEDLNQGQKKKDSIIGTATLNLAEFASLSEKSGKEWFETNVPLTIQGRKVEGGPSLCLSLRMVELKATHQSAQGFVVPVYGSPLSSGPVSPFKDENYAVTVNTDSLSDSEGESDENKNRSNNWNSINYENLVGANWFGGSIYSETSFNPEAGGLVYYSNKKPDLESQGQENPVLSPRSRLRIFAWRKRKPSFRSSKVKGEPLLKKDCREEGGDDIDFDRRFLSSSDESSSGWYKSEEDSTTNRSSISEFGDDNFAVGSWEQKEIVSRDGHMKLQTQVFFASIDQRSERAAGESACTALVAVIANWLQSNPNEIPIKSDFDSLIREGSLEWRNLCENQTYIEQFPDKHFDLETVLQAKICPLAEVPGKSFIGFFNPEGLEGEDFNFLEGAMSFDNIWDEINSCECPSNGLVYIVSWNDHFFVLKVEPDACYIIDTLGERLHEGCNQAFVVKFDKDTVIHRLPTETALSGEKSKEDNENNNKPAKKSRSGFLWEKKSKSKKNLTEESSVCVPKAEESEIVKEEEIVEVCKGKEACKEYIKSFLAAVPLRELRNDVRRGSVASVHQRLQIEFHYTESVQLVVETDITAKDGKARRILFDDTEEEDGTDATTDGIAVEDSAEEEITVMDLAVTTDGIAIEDSAEKEITVMDLAVTTDGIAIEDSAEDGVTVMDVAERENSAA
ncbi:hypothetical protein ACFE04_000433 [Oxalis oulophora]